MAELPGFRPRRALGKTGFVATRVGIGDLADRKIALETCVATARRALDAGLNVIDTAPGYEDGYSEQIVGHAVRASGRRDALFVISKIDHHEEPVEAQIDGSLARLGLDHTDAFVFHGLSKVETYERLMAPGAGFEQLAACIRKGKTRFGGISSHNPEVLKRAIAAGVCDVVMFAIGPFVDARYVDEILPLAKAKGVGTVCFKTFGAGKLLGDTAGYSQPLAVRPRGKVSSGGSDAGDAVLPRLSVRDCVAYTLTCDPDVALWGMSFPNEQDAALTAAAAFAGPLSRDEMDALRRRARDAIRDKGPCWWNPEPQAL